MGTRNPLADSFAQDIDSTELLVEGASQLLVNRDFEAREDIQAVLALAADNRVDATSAKTAARNTVNLAQELTTIGAGRTYLVVFIRDRKIWINAYSVFEYIVDDYWIKLKSTTCNLLGLSGSR